MTAPSQFELFSLYRKGRLQEAEQLCHIILHNDPRNFAVLHLLGLIALDTNRTPMAAALLQQAIAINPRHSAAYGHLSNALRQLDRGTDALELLNKAVAIDPRSSELWTGRAAVLNDLERYQDALTSAQKAITLEPANAEAHNILGIAHRHLGHYQQALASYRKAVELRPQFADAQFNMGNALSELGRHEDAAAAYQQAISSAPHFALAYNNLGTALRHLHRLPEALRAVDKAIELAPRLAEAHNDRGNLLKELRRYQEALASYKTALGFRSDHAEIHYNIGNVLCSLKSFAAAMAAYDAALRSKGDFGEAWIGRGNALIGLGRPDEALAAYDRALTLKPDSPAAWVGRGDAFFARKQYDEADRCYDRALEVADDFALAWFGRGNVRFQRNLVDEALSDYEQVLACMPDYLPAKAADCFCELQILYDCTATIVRRRSAYERKLLSLEAEVQGGQLPGDLTDLLGFGQPFYLAYQGHDDRDLQQIFGSMASQIMARAFPEPTPMRLAAQNEKIRIGFVSAFFYEHSNWKIPIKGWLGQLDRGRFQVYGYHVGDTADAQTTLAAAMCDRFVHRSMSVEEWRRLIVADAPHILIYPGLFMDGISLQLASLRLAPVQCNSWGHPDTSGIPTLDYYLSSDLMEPADAAGHYTEKLIRLPKLSVYYEPTATERSSVTRSQLGLRDDAVVFWCGQSLYKYLPQYDAVFVRIAAAFPNCQFVFIRHFAAKEITDVFAKRLEQAFANAGRNASDHIILLDRLERGDFVGAMGQCDVFLDSLGWSGCNSTLESLAVDLPIVTLEGPLMRGRHSAAILRMMGVTEPIAGTVDDYVAMAAGLAANPDQRLRLSRAIAANKYRVYRDRACIEALEDFLERVGRQPHGTPKQASQSQQ